MDINSIPRNIDIARKKIVEFQELYPRSKLVIKEYPPRSVSTRNIERFITKYMRKNRKPDVIIVDYISLLNPSIRSHKETSYERVGTVATDLRRMSYIFECPVIAPIQVNRGGYGTNDATMEHISESMQVGHHTEFLGNLWQQDGDREAGIMNLSILKQRDGWTGKPIKFGINYSNLTIFDIEQKKQPVDIPKEKGNELIQDINNL